MIFNCTHCCKAISSEAEKCPYCMIELQAVVQEMSLIEINPQEAIKPLKLFAKRRIARARRASKSVPGTITQIVNGIKSTHRQQPL